MNAAHTSSPLPSLQALRVLEAATRLESFTAAAAELGVTHGAISRQIDTLESWAGGPLFLRSGRRMAATERARGLVTQTREALRILGDAFGHPLLPRHSGGLRLSTTPAIARLWLLPRLATIDAEHAGLITAIETSTTLDAGWSKDVDVALRYGPGGWPNVQAVHLAGEALVPVAAPALLKRFPDWRDAPMISTPYQSWRVWFDAVNRSPPAHLNQGLEVPDAGLALDAAVLGLGVALARRRLAASMIAAGTLCIVADDTVSDQYEYHLVWPATSRKKSAIDQLIHVLERLFETSMLA